ncbi:Hsp20/alpha crystallin family protein [Candidatus Acidulodesulfobacterium sp. H_13]|uniref:Hsp20/alpha crystallin family protein n=1 Tax=Candidatus Acidulodesulfobacterium sp. H_13 TaxID=3395470 RepID=UPI003AF4C653
MKKIVKFDPFYPIRNEFEKSFFDFFNPVIRTKVGYIEPEVDVLEKDENIVVKAQVPGIPKENINIEVNGSQLIIKGEHKQEKEEKKENFYRQEIQYGSFYRIIDLPAEAEKQSATASLKNGELEIVLKKSIASSPKKIEIK